MNPNFFKIPCLISVLAFTLLANHRAHQAAIEAGGQPVDTTGVIAAGAALQRISNQFHFTEGPAVDKQGNIFFTDQPDDAIWQYKNDGTLSLFLQPAGRSNGLTFDHAGFIIACADEKNELWRIAPDGQKKVLYKAPKRRRLNGPNDVWVDARNGIYLTDPYYQRPWWKRKKPALKGQYVYYLPPGKNRLVAVETTLKQPNGIAGTPDGKQLFVADIGDGKIYKYSIAPDGTLLNKQLLIGQGSDGLTLDKEGNLYLTGDGVTVYDSVGKKIEHIAVPEKWTSNVCFGGADRKDLFITASESLYKIRMTVSGVE